MSYDAGCQVKCYQTLQLTLWTLCSRKSCQRPNGNAIQSLTLQSAYDKWPKKDSLLFFGTLFCLCLFSSSTWHWRWERWSMIAFFSTPPVLLFSFHHKVPSYSPPYSTSPPADTDCLSDWAPSRQDQLGRKWNSSISICHNQLDLLNIYVSVLKLPRDKDLTRWSLRCPISSDWNEHTVVCSTSSLWLFQNFVTQSVMQT